MPDPLLLEGTPDPPAPGAPTLVYDYPNLGKREWNYRTHVDMSTAVTEENMLGIDVSYVVETRWFNAFRAEHVAMYDVKGTERVPTGRTEERQENGLCWTVEEVTVRYWEQLAYDESVQYEIWRINTTKDEYFQFFTGTGGVAVEAGAGITQAGAAKVATNLAARSAAMASTLGATASAQGATVALLSDAAVVVGATGQVVLVGATAFLATTSIWVSHFEDDRMVDGAGSRNATGRKEAEGWKLVRRFWDRKIVVDEQPE